MKVRWIAEGYDRKIGEEFEVSEEQAQSLIAAGQAEAVEEKGGKK